MAYDFAIVCTQRSGSHLLASALNSHPEISCADEYGRPPDEGQSRIHGRIVMYNYLRQAWREIARARIIHLVRQDFRATARSKLELQEEVRAAQAEGREPVIHALRTGPWRPGHFVDSARVFRKARQVRAKVENARALLVRTRRPVLDVVYEDLTSGGRNVHSIPAGVSSQIARFLRVSDIGPLETPLRKTG